MGTLNKDDADLMVQAVNSKIESLVNQAVKNAPNDKETEGRVLSKNDDNTYAILIKNAKFTSIPQDRSLGEIATNTIVKVKIPNGQMTNAYICAVVDGTISKNGGGGEGGTNVYVNSVKQDTINFTSDPQTQIDNTVKTSGDQSIAGTKNFTGKIKGSSAYFPNGFGALGTEAIPSFTFSDAVNVGMELGRRDGTAGTPYIDFHTDGSSSTDFNARMLASGNALNITATGGLLVNGTNVGVNSYSLNESGYNGYIRYDNGLQIVWGRVTGYNKTFYYPASFKSNSSYAVSGVSEGWTGSYGNYGMSSLTTTSFYLNADKSANWDYLAIGFWK